MKMKVKMKMSSLLSPAPAVLFLLSSYLAIAQPLEPAVPGTTSAVLDVQGHELQSNTSYYIFPAINSGNNKGGGLALMSRNRTCPFNVVQESLPLSHGLPLRFLPSDKKDNDVKMSTDMNIAFYAATICVQSTVWRVGGVDRITGHRYVTSGSTIGRPGPDTVSNWFKIEKHGDDGYYKIVYCPSVCTFCRVVCGNVGVIHEDGKGWLGLSDELLVVMFKKV